MRALLALSLVGCASATPAVRSDTPPPIEATHENAVQPQPRELPAAVDPATIVGYVRGVAMPEGGRGEEGTVQSLDSEPANEHITRLRFAVSKAGFGSFVVLVPKTLPIPFAVADRVSIRATGYGGGPNHRVALTMRAHDGSLLLAIDRAPEDWKVERGRRVESRDEGDYIAHEHEVVFETGGKTLVVSPGDWARFDTVDASYYLWGVAVERTRRGRGPPPPDYVGGWLDFAIVRAGK